MVARDVGSIADCFTDGVAFHIPGRNAPSGDYRGKQEVLTRLFQHWEEAFGGLEIDVHDVLADDEHVVVLSERAAPSTCAPRPSTTSVTGGSPRRG